MAFVKGLWGKLMLKLGFIAKSELMNNSLLHIIDKRYRPSYAITAKATREYNSDE